jgi:TRAP-type C4-dicarboxylate transport system permease large subunit
VCHPPVGAILFVGWRGRQGLDRAGHARDLAVAVMLVVLMFVTYIPDISLWRPRQVLR